jgi:uncharacterized protein (TIGR03435 family)
LTAPRGGAKFGTAVLAAIFAVSATAQPKLKFEAASVRRAKGDDSVSEACRGTDTKLPPAGVPIRVPPLGRCVITNAQLDHLVAFAYQLHDADAIKGPAWIHDGKVRFSVVAVAPHPESATVGDLLAMLKDLIAERFKARVRIDFKPADGYALAVAKGVPRISPSSPDQVRDTVQAPEWPRTVTARAWTMGALAEYIESIVAEPVADETGLKGGYDFTFTVENGDPQSWVAAVRSIGFRLQRGKVPVPYATVESAELPIEN